MKRLITILAAIWVLPGGIAYAAEWKAYAPMGGGKGVAVIDLDVNDAWGIIKAGGEKGIPAASRDGRLVFVPVTSGEGVLVIDTRTDGVIKEVNVGGGPFYTDVTADGRHLLVSTQGETSVAVVDTASLSLAGRIEIGCMPGSVRAAPSGDLAYVIGEDAGKVFRLDVKAMKVDATFEMPSASSLAVSPSGDRLFVDCGEERVIKICDAGSMKVSTTIPAYGLFGMALTPDGKELWFPGPSGKVTVYSLAEGRKVAEINSDAGASYLQITPGPDGKAMYATPCGPDGDKVYIYDAAKKEKAGEITLPSGSRGIVLISR